MRIVFIFIVASLVLISVSSGQLLQLRAVTSAYAWQRQDTVGLSSGHLYGYQALQFSLVGSSLSFHTYMQGFNDFAGPLKNEGQFRLYNLYLRWSDIFGMVDVKLGRQAIFAGVGNNSIDGGTLSLKFLESRVKLLGYYGTLMPPRLKAGLIENRSSNFMTGTQLLVSPYDFATFSASWMRKKIRPDAYSAIRRDTLFNRTVLEITPSATAEEYFSGDFNLDLPQLLDAYLRYDYDMNFERTSRWQFFGRLKVLSNLSLTAEYLYREPRLSFNSIFSVFTYNTVKDYEAGIEYAPIHDWQFFGKYGSISYGDVDEERITIGGSGTYVSASIAHNVGYNGKISSASVNVGYPLWNRTLTPTATLGYAQYKLSGEKTELENALALTGGAVYRPSPWWMVDGQIQWIQNKIYSNDLRLFLRGSFLLSHQFGLF